MTWEILVPFSSRKDSTVDLLAATKALPADEARVTRQLVLGAYTDGWGASAGELLDHLEKASPAERRAVLDQARVKAGLPTTAEVEAHRQVVAASRAGRIRSAVETRPLRLAFRPGGALVDLNELEDDAARERERQASREHARLAHDRDRAVEAEETRARERASAEQLAREVPDHLFLP